MLSTPKSLGGWGVTGLDVSTSPLADFKCNVTALAEWHGRIYVGGVFTAVANGVPRRRSPTSRRSTGHRRLGRTFRPTLNGGVWDLAVTPKGQLLVAGYFGDVNGDAARGVVALNPSTGAVDPTFKARRPGTPGPGSGVRTMDVEGGWVYIGGHVTVVTGGPGAQAATARGKNLFRLAWNGPPGRQLQAVLSTAPFQVYASRLGDRVYAAGQFGTVNGVRQGGPAVLSATNGGLVPGVADVSPVQQAVCDLRALLRRSSRRRTAAGSWRAHRAWAPELGRDASTCWYGPRHRRPPGPAGAGGDFQSLVETNGVVYAACHCWGYDYSGAYTVATPGRHPRPTAVRPG